MEEIYSYFLKKEKENGDILIKDFSSYFSYVKIKLAVIARFTNFF